MGFGYINSNWIAKHNSVISPFTVVSTKLEAPNHQPDPKTLLSNGPDKFRNLKSDRRKEVNLIEKPLDFFSIAYRMFAFRNIIFPREVLSCNER